MRFETSAEYVRQKLDQTLALSGVSIVDGSGLSRGNKLTARQLNSVLDKLKPHKTLLQRFALVSNHSVAAYAKTGTLDGVQTLAGYLEVDKQEFQFVFMFNRATPYRYRETLLQRLAEQLALP